MELRVLRYFIEVAREQNITAAAERLHVTQPTLSKQLIDLENELGKKLFVRGKRRTVLTEDGQFLYRRAQEIVDRYADTDDDRLLPFISAQKYNDAIKRVFLAARLTRLVTVLEPNAFCTWLNVKPSITITG